MTLVDANILIYAHVTSLPQHERAREWLDHYSTDGDFARFPRLRWTNPLDA